MLKTFYGCVLIIFCETICLKEFSISYITQKDVREKLDELRNNFFKNRFSSSVLKNFFRGKMSTQKE